MVAWRYGISLLVFNSISHSFATLTREISRWTLEEKFHVSARPCIIVYLLLKTQSPIAMKSRKRKKREKLRDKREEESIAITWLTEKGSENLAKCCSVSFQSWMNQWNCPEVNVQAQGLGKIFNYGLWKVARVWVFLKSVGMVVQSGLKLYDLTVMAAGVQMKEFVIAPFAQRHHVFVWSNWRQN